MVLIQDITGGKCTDCVCFDHVILIVDKLKADLARRPWV
jgi:hypothetical protein